MFKSIKKRLKDQRGLTLVELLAVVVILGIISAIAVPNIGGLIDNTKKEAHVANAQQMVNSAKLAIASDKSLQKTGTYWLTLNYLQTNNFLDEVEDPDGVAGGYLEGSLNKESGDTPSTSISTASFVKIENGKVTKVKLVNSTRGVQTTNKTSVSVAELDNDSIVNKTN